MPPKYKINPFAKAVKRTHATDLQLKVPETKLSLYGEITAFTARFGHATKRISAPRLDAA